MRLAVALALMLAPPVGIVVAAGPVAADGTASEDRPDNPYVTAISRSDDGPTPALGPEAGETDIDETPLTPLDPLDLPDAARGNATLTVVPPKVDQGGGD